MPSFTEGWRSSGEENPFLGIAAIATSALETLQHLPQRQVSAQPARSEFSLDERPLDERSADERPTEVLPASAELLAIARDLHHQPFTRKRTSRESFEQSPEKRDREDRDQILTIGESSSATVLRNSSQTTQRNTRSWQSADVPFTAPSLPGSPTPVPALNRHGILAGFNAAVEYLDHPDEFAIWPLAEYGANGLPTSRPLRGPYTPSEQETMEAVLQEIPARREDRRALQERIDPYKAMRTSLEDAKKRQHNRLRIRLSADFTDSQSSTGDISTDLVDDEGAASDSDSNVGHDISMMLASVNRRIPEGTDVALPTSPMPESPRLTDRPVPAVENPSRRPSNESRVSSEMELDTLSSISHHSSDSECDPFPVLPPVIEQPCTPQKKNQDNRMQADTATPRRTATPGQNSTPRPSSTPRQTTVPGPSSKPSRAVTPQKESEDHKPASTSNSGSQRGRVPLLGFFGSHAIAGRPQRNNWVPSVQFRSGAPGVDKRDGQPKCYGCEAKGSGSG